MELTRHLLSERIFYLESTGKGEALQELVRLTCGTAPFLEEEATQRAVQERESVVSSWLAPGIAIPHARLPNLSEFVVSLGISPQGVEYESFDGSPVHLLFLILGNQREADRHIQLLADVARTFRDPTLKEALLAARGREQIYRLLQKPAPARQPAAAARLAADLSHLVLSHALALAEEVRARAILLNADALESLEVLTTVRTETLVLLVSQHLADIPVELPFPFKTIHLPFAGLNRANQVDLALLFALSQGLLSQHDQVVSLFGIPGSGHLDSLMVIDLARELPTYLPAQEAAFLEDVAPQVLERVLQIATSLAREGREGRPVGTLFVLGDYQAVRAMSRQMVINPFKGYRDEEKSVLDPSLEETLKEFATIDGAFLIEGNGVLQAAGTYLRADVAAVEMPSGLGARHAAAAGITAATRALAVVISQSTGKVSLFKAGRAILVLDKPKG